MVWFGFILFGLFLWVFLRKADVGFGNLVSPVSSSESQHVPNIAFLFEFMKSKLNSNLFLETRFIGASARLLGPGDFHVEQTFQRHLGNNPSRTQEVADQAPGDAAVHH